MSQSSCEIQALVRHIIQEEAKAKIEGRKEEVNLRVQKDIIDTHFNRTLVLDIGMPACSNWILFAGRVTNKVPKKSS